MVGCSRKPVAPRFFALKSGIVSPQFAFHNEPDHVFRLMTTRREFIQKKPNPELAHKLTRINLVLTLIVWTLVGSMQRIHLQLPDGVDLSFLPAFNAIINSLVAICLISAGIAIWAQHAKLHRSLILAAVGLSALFLISYVTYHITAGETKFGGQGSVRTVYFSLLISHIALAAISFPIILQSLVYAFSCQFAKHRRMVRWAYPMWLYVAITGPIIYLMLRSYY